MMTEIAVRRLFNQQLLSPQFSHPGEVAAWMGAMQSQDYLGALWSLGMRLPGSRDREIEQAIETKQIVRSWAPRGTLHFTAARDLPWMLAVCAGHIVAASQRRYGELELDEATMQRSNALIVRALQERQPRPRSELLEWLQRNGISTTGQRAPYLLQRAALDGLVCQTTTRRNNPNYWLMEDAVPDPERLSPEEGRAELARRYFASHGPAALADFVWWSGLPVAEARAGIEAAGAQLCRETSGGVPYWMAESSPAARPGKTIALPNEPTAYLLPSYDEFWISYKDRSAIVSAGDHGRVWQNNGFSPTLAINGQVVGTWKRTLKKDRVVVTVSPFAPLNEPQLNALETTVRQYGQFLSLEAETMMA